MPSSVTVQDVDRLIELFRQLQSLKPNLPPRNKRLWAKCQAQARQELDAVINRRHFIAPPNACELDETSYIHNLLSIPEPADNTQEQSNDNAIKQLQKELEHLEKLYLEKDDNAPRFSTTECRQKPNAVLQKQINRKAETIYCEKDPAYGRAVSAAKQERADLLKQIDYALLPIQTELLEFPRVDKTILAIQEFDLNIRNMPRIDPKWLDGQISMSIDVLEACRANIERQNRLSERDTVKPKSHKTSSQRQTENKAQPKFSRQKKNDMDRWQLMGLLLKHHKAYADDGEEVNYTPLTQKEICRELKWNQPKTSRVMKMVFGDDAMTRYKQCLSSGEIKGFIQRGEDQSDRMVEAFTEPDED